MGLSNKYINEICFAVCKKFFGTYSCDSIPQNIPVNSSIIVNLDKQKNKGTHFICIIRKSQFTIYFDPLGFPCYNADILKHLISWSDQTFENSLNIQNLKSVFCGFYCIACVLAFELNLPFDFFLSLFHTTNNIINDKIVVQVIKILIEKI